MLILFKIQWNILTLRGLYFICFFYTLTKWKTSCVLWIEVCIFSTTFCFLRNIFCVCIMK